MTETDAIYDFRRRAFHYRGLKGLRAETSEAPFTLWFRYSHEVNLKDLALMADFWDAGLVRSVTPRMGYLSQNHPISKN